MIVHWSSWRKPSMVSTLITVTIHAWTSHAWTVAAVYPYESSTSVVVHLGLKTPSVKTVSAISHHISEVVCWSLNGMNECERYFRRSVCRDDILRKYANGLIILSRFYVSVANDILICNLSCNWRNYNLLCYIAVERSSGPLLLTYIICFRSWHG